MTAQTDLLKELRIDRSAPPPAPARRGLWIALAIAAAVLLLALAGWALFGRDDAPRVQTASVVAIGGGNGGSGSVLDATGYVVARRMATVSAKVTGKVREVLIEEGQHVEAGEVMATLDPVDAAVVRAPFAGVVIAKAAQPGEMISPLSAGGGFTRTGIGTIVDMDSLEVEVDVGESYIGRVKPGLPIEATLNAYPDWQIPGEVIAIIPTADRGKATVKVRIALDEKDERIVPEMGVRVSFMEKAQPAQADAPKPGVLAPAAAIVDRDGEQVAFVLKDASAEQGTVVSRQLEVGRSLGDDREVTSGLSAGDVVVLDPPQTLADGDSVRIAEDTDLAAD